MTLIFFTFLSVRDPTWFARFKSVAYTVLFKE